MNIPSHMRKARAISLLLCFALLCPPLFIPASCTEPLCHFAGTVSAKSAVLMETGDEIFLFEKDPDLRLGEASTTKIMTALVASELLPLSKVVSIPPEAVGIEGSSVYLKEGELLSVRELLLALLLASANDAAVALAIASAGSVAAFAELMNKKARELGLENTHFTNPHGLSDEEHYTTARELAIIAAEALKKSELREIFAARRATIPSGVSASLPEGEGVRYLYNHNKLLSLYEGAIGIKTGYTRATGRCLVSAAERDGMTLICVTLNAPDDWNDHTALLDFGFSSYERRVLYGAGELCFPYAVSGGCEQYVTAANGEPLIMTLPKNCSDTPLLRFEFPQRFELAPIDANTLLGRVTVSLGERQISTALVAAYRVASTSEEKRKRFIFFDF